MQDSGGGRGCGRLAIQAVYVQPDRHDKTRSRAARQPDRTVTIVRDEMPAAFVEWVER